MNSSTLWDTENKGFIPYSFEEHPDNIRLAPPCVFKSSDIDLFLYGMTPEQAERKIEHILAVLGNSVRNIIRSENCITFIRKWPNRNVQVLRNIQFCVKNFAILFCFIVCETTDSFRFQNTGDIEAVLFEG